MPSPPDGAVRLAVGDVAIVVDPAKGARATSWTVGDHELLGSYGPDPVQYGMYPMAPWAGRIRDNGVTWGGEDHVLPVTVPPWAMHGTVLRQAASLVDVHRAADEARLVARFDDHPGWPWPMAVEVSWLLRERHLTTVIDVHASSVPFPAVVGWHPWFRRMLGVGDPLEWSLAAAGQLVRGSDHLPTGAVVAFDPCAGPFDDALLVPDGCAHVRWPGVLDLTIRSDHPWFVVFDELRDYVCVEPQSGPPDGLRADLDPPAAVAAVGSPHRMITTWAMDLLPR